MKKTLLSSLALVCFTISGTAWTAPSTYKLDPNHTHPSFEVDHSGGLSVWRGLFKSTQGTVTLDRAAATGTVDVTIDASSVDFGLDSLSQHVIAADILDVAKFPTATYKGTLGDFKDGAPTTVTGELTLHGVTKPVNLQIDSFKCIQNPMLKREVCGADAIGTFNRADFGVNYGQKSGVKQDVNLRIQVEGTKSE